jgi:hypothetical protein
MRIAVGVDTGKGRHQAAAYDPQGDRIVGQVGFSVDRADSNTSVSSWNIWRPSQTRLSSVSRRPDTIT